jgi:hypothetical protein
MVNCALPGCPYKPLPLWERLTVYVVVAIFVLWKPALNAIGFGMEDNLRNAILVIRGSIAYPIIGFLSSFYLGYKDDADHHWSLILNAFGFPGLLIGLAIMFSK